MKRSYTQQSTQSTGSHVAKKSRVPRPISFNKPQPVNSWGRFSKNVGFPNKLLMRHRFTEVGNLSSAAGALGTFNYRANGMFDPNQTSTGHQPLYFDQLAAVYDHYTVIGSVIKVKFIPLAGNTVPMLVGIMKNDDTVITPTLAINLVEQSGTVSGVLTNPGAQPYLTLTQKFSAKGTFGGNALSNDNLQGNATSDPAEQTLFTLFAQSIDLTSSTQCYLQIDIEYLAVWDELRDISGS